MPKPKMIEVDTTKDEYRVEGFRGTWGFLSNFAPSPIQFGPYQVDTAEHLYQGLKTTNPAWRKRIFVADRPHDAKYIGRHELPLRLIRKGWDEGEPEPVKLTVMRFVIWEKFSQNHDLGTFLIETRNRLLLHVNKHDDIYWGMVRDRDSGLLKGENWLGIILMETRTTLEILRSLKIRDERWLRTTLGGPVI